MNISDLFANAISNPNRSRSSAPPRFYFSGDLQQMAVTGEFLLNAGVSVELRNVYPTVAMEDKTKALKLIWNSKISGWHHYEKDYIELNICTPKEFQDAMAVF
jgi:hypothetical protein